jgi:hypothetical protein
MTTPSRARDVMAAAAASSETLFNFAYSINISAAASNSALCKTLQIIYLHYAVYRFVLSDFKIEKVISRRKSRLTCFS